MIDRLCERKIQGLKVYCVNQKEGCKWIGELQYMEEHLKRDPDNTETGGCRYQETTCKKCDKKLLYDQLKSHIENNCAYRVVECNFKFAGCNFQGPKYSMPNHIQEKMSEHLSFMAVRFEELQSKPKSYRWLYTSVLFSLLILVVIYISYSKMTELSSIYNKRFDDMNNEIAKSQKAFEDLLTSQLERYSDDVQSKLSEHKKHRKNLTSVIEIHGREIDDLESNFTHKIDQLIKRYALIHKDLMQRLLDQERDLRKLRNSHDMKFASINETVTTNQLAFGDFKDDIIDREYELKELTSQLEWYSDNIQSRLSEYEKRIKNLTRVIEMHRQKIDDLESSFSHRIDNSIKAIQEYLRSWIPLKIT